MRSCLASIAPFLWLLRDEPQRAVELVHLVDEHREVHGARLGHVVVGLPGAVVLVPLPDVAVEGGLSVDLELVDVGAVAQELLGRLDEARMMDQRLEHRMVFVHGEGGAHHVARLLAHILLAALGEHLGDRVLQDLRLLGREVVREEQIAFVVETLELLRGELHGGSSWLVLAPLSGRAGNHDLQASGENVGHLLGVPAAERFGLAGLSRFQRA